jgi:hypothetical protein
VILKGILAGQQCSDYVKMNDKEYKNTKLYKIHIHPKNFCGK